MIKRSWPPHPWPLHLVPLAILAATLAACSQNAVPTGPPAPVVTARPSASPLATARPGAASTKPAASPAPSAAFDPTGVKLVVRVVVGGLESPLDVTSAEDGSGRLFVVEQAGRIRVVTEDRKSTRLNSSHRH